MANQVFSGSTNVSGDTFFHIIPSGQRGFLNVYVVSSGSFGTLTLEAVAPDASSTAVPVEGGREITATGLHVFEAASFKGQLTLASATGATVEVWVESELEAHARIQAEARSA